MDCAEQVTIGVQSEARSMGNAARMERTPDMVPSVNAASHSVSSICSKYPSPGPMVCTRLLRCPQRSEMVANPAAMDTASVISTLMPMASGAPFARNESTAASRAAQLLAITATLTPSDAKVSAMASPMPLLPPVTTAFEPAKPRSIVLLPISDAFRSRIWICGLRDRFSRHTQPAQAEAQSTLANVGAFAFACRPLTFGASPHHALDRLRIGDRIDVVELAVFQAALKLFDEWCEHLRVCGLNQFRGGEHLRLGLLGQAAQIGLDVLVERQVESSVDPGNHRVNRSCSSRHFLCQPQHFSVVPVALKSRNQLVL